MIVIYLDELIALNLISDYVVIKLTAKICGLDYKRRNIILALLFGIVYGVGSVYIGLLSAFLLKLTAGAAVYVIAFGLENTSIKNLAIFFIMASFFAGTLSAVYEHTGQSTVVFAVVFGVLYYGIAVAFDKLLVSPDMKNGLYKTAEIDCAAGRKIDIRVMIDTGNMLRDPFSGNNVMVVDKATLSKVFTERETALINKAEKYGALEALDGYEPDAESLKFIPVFYSVVGKENDVMLAFKPKSVRLGNKTRRDIVVALSPDKITADIGCAGIVGVV